MTREELHILVQRYLDGEADEAERERLLAMAGRDAEVARLLEEERALQDALSGAAQAVEAGGDFVAAVMEGVRRCKPEKVRAIRPRVETTRIRTWLCRAAVVAAAVCLALIAHNDFISVNHECKRAEAKGIVISVLQADGEVSVNLPDGQSDPLTSRDNLPQQSSITTNSESRAKFNLASAEVRLNNDSMVCYESFEADLLKLTLKEGQLNIDCNPAKGAGVMVTTTLATITAYDAKFDLQAIVCYEGIVTDMEGNRYLPDPPESFHASLLKFAYDDMTGCLYASSINGKTWHLLYRKGFGYVKRQPGYYLNLHLRENNTGPQSSIYGPNPRIPGVGGGMGTDPWNPTTPQVPQPRIPGAGGGMGTDPWNPTTPQIPQPRIPGMNNTQGPGIGARTYYGDHMLTDSQGRNVGDWGYEGPAGATEPVYSQKGPTMQRKVIQVGITVSRGCVYVKYLGKDEEQTMNAPRRMLITAYEPRDVAVIRTGPYVSQAEAEHANSWWENNQRFNPRQPETITPAPRPRPQTERPKKDYNQPNSMSVCLKEILAESDECTIVVQGKLDNGMTFTQSYTLRKGEDLGWYEAFATDRGKQYVDMRTPYRLKLILPPTEGNQTARVVLEMPVAKGVEINLPLGVTLPCTVPPKE